MNRRLRARAELSIQIGTHWDTLTGPDVVAARAALKHVHDAPAPADDTDADVDAA